MGQKKSNLVNGLELISKIDQIKGKSVLIIGDIGLDEYVMGQVRRISPEAPVPVLEVEEEDSRLGLAGNVAQNVVSLGGKAILVSVVGQDMSAISLKELLKKYGVDPSYLVTDFSRPTTKKTRVMAKHHHLVRVDYELRKYLDAKLEGELLGQVENLVPKSDIIILQDYAKGVISRKVVESVVQIAHKHGKRVLLDPHRANPAEFYKGVDLIKPNFDEALALAGIAYEDFKMQGTKVQEVGEILRNKVQAEDLVLTQGKDGMMLFHKGEIKLVPTYARQVFDVTGAGDTVIAALALGLAGGLSLEESSILANFAAGVVVGKVGCVPCGRDELVEYIESFQ